MSIVDTVTIARIFNYISEHHYGRGSGNETCHINIISFKTGADLKNKNSYFVLDRFGVYILLIFRINLLLSQLRCARVCYTYLLYAFLSRTLWLNI